MALLLEYDFTNLSDGDPLPTEIGYGVLREDAGVFSVVDEANPAAYFKASKQPDETISKALFAYESSPGPGGATDQRGLICSPGILEGLNSDVSVEFANPMKFFSSGIDEFLLQILLRMLVHHLHMIILRLQSLLILPVILFCCIQVLRVLLVLL